MRAFVGLSLLLLLARSAAAAGDPLTLAQVLADVRARHPEIGSANATAAADRERIVQSGAWEDPVAGLELQRINNNTRLFSYDMAEVSFSQKIPLSGNLARRRAAANAEAGVSAAAVRTRTYMVLASARDAYSPSSALANNSPSLPLPSASSCQAADLVRSRLATGGTDTSALILAERERAQLQERLIMLEREAADAAATLNVLRNLPPQSPVGDLAAPPIPSGEAFATLEAAQAHALIHRPELGEAEARITAAGRAADVAARAWRPDPEVMVKARHVQAGGRAINDYDTGFAVGIPWANNDKYRAAQRETARRREAAELDAAALRTRTAGEIREMWTRRDTARRNVELYRDRLLPLARAGADSLRAGLVTGKIPRRARRRAARPRRGRGVAPRRQPRRFSPLPRHARDPHRRRRPVMKRFLLFLRLPRSVRRFRPRRRAGPSVYRCPMHPHIKSPKPGKCTICGMDLVISAPATNADASTFSLTKSQITAIGVETAVVSRQALTRTLRVNGVIDDDDSRHRLLTAWAEGRVEKLHVNIVGAVVKAGEPSLELYSPELQAAQREFVQLARAGELAASALPAARARLQRMGLAETQLTALLKTGEPPLVTTIFAPTPAPSSPNPSTRASG